MSFARRLSIFSSFIAFCAVYPIELLRMSTCVSDSTVDQESTTQIDDRSEQPQEANEKVSITFF